MARNRKNIVQRFGGRDDKIHPSLLSMLRLQECRNIDMDSDAANTRLGRQRVITALPPSSLRPTSALGGGLLEIGSPDSGHWLFYIMDGGPVAGPSLVAARDADTPTTQNADINPTGASSGTQEGSAADPPNDATQPAFV